MNKTIIINSIKLIRGGSYMKNVLRVEHVNKIYGHKNVLNDINFSINEGEIVGLVGPNGAGKTTIMKIITGLTPSYEGNIFINNENIKDKFKNKTHTKKVGCIIETPGFYPNLSGYENLKFFAELSGLDDLNQINTIVENLGLQNAINKKVSSYSLGMRQRLGIAQSVLTYPPLLILDEPTNGLDPNIIPEIRKFIINIAKNNKTAVLISSHILSELEIMCDKIVFIQKGHIITPENNNNPNEIRIKITTSNIAKLQKFLRKENYELYNLTYNSLEIKVNAINLESLTNSIHKNGIPFSTIEHITESLEDKFLNLMRGDLVD